MAHWSSLTTSLDEQLPRHVAEELSARLGHAEAFADLDAPVVHPDAGDTVERHVRLQHRLVAGAKAGRVLAPIRRVIAADGIADARVLHDPMPGDDAAPGRLHLVAGGAWLHRRQRRVEALDH